ncbi:MAG: 50S ribosomal protein L35 [Alphaproteobacteria bacterium]
MPKMKTKSGVKKRFSLTASGKVKAKGAFSRHLLSNKSKRSKLKHRGTYVLCEADANKVRDNWMPYG